VIETVLGRGHRNITAKHRSTMMFTKDSEITERGDCIVAVKINKAISDLSDDFRQEILKGKRVYVKIACGRAVQSFYGYGSSMLVLKDDREIVIRKSSYIDKRTLLINATCSAYLLDRELVKNLRKEKKVRIEMVV